MTRKPSLSRLIEQEKLLYIEVEQMRYSLYLHDTSLIFELFSAFYFAGQDITRLFIKAKTRQIPTLVAKKMSIDSLTKKKRSLIFLSKTPYAWIIFLLRSFKRVVSLAAAPRSRRGPRSQKNKSLLIFGTTTTADLQARSVQIARTISKKMSVIYIEGVFDEGGRPGYRIIEQSVQFTAVRLTAKRTLHLSYQNPSPKEISFLKQSFKLLAFSFSLSAFQTYVHHPFWTTVFPFKKNSYIFDHVDNFAQSQNAAIHIIRSEKKTLKNALLVTAPHKKLLRNKKDVLVKNGVEWNMFKDTSKMIQTCDVGLCWIKKPVLGYIGTLDEKIDEKLLGHLAGAFPSASVVLVGNTDYRPVIEVAEAYPNIFPVGKQPYKKLPLFLQSFDILITPFKYNKSTTLIHPEFPLYLASGKPIVCTCNEKGCLPAEAKIQLRGRRPRVEPERRRAKRLYYAPKTHSDWLLAVAEALKEKKRSKKRSLRIAAAKKLFWKSPKFA